MTHRIDIREHLTSTAGRALITLGQAVDASEIDCSLLELVKMREAPFFSHRERAALEWAEAVTVIADARVPDEVYERTTRYFDEAQIVALTMAVVATNAWNRLVISFRVPVGTYQPQQVRVSH